jgi:hypothetical protein
MTVVNSNRLGFNGGRHYSFLNRPVLVDCNFVVDSTNGNGLGIRNLKGSGVQAVFMNTSASFTGTTHSGTNVIDGISGGTASLVIGMPIQGSNIPAGTTIASISSSSAITASALSTGSASGETITYQGLAPSGMANPMHQSASVGYCWVQLANNYNRYAGGYNGFVSPSSGSPIQINTGTAGLTVGTAYEIATVGHAAEGQATIAPVADVSGSLASKYFVVYDSYGNTWVVWFSVSGVGARPNLGTAAPDGTMGLHYVQQTITANSSAATIGAALVLTLENLQSGVAGVLSFTASGTTTVTIANTSTVQYHLPGVPVDGVAPLATGFTFALTVDDHNTKDWEAVGLPKGVTPAVGASFIATATGAGSSTGTAIAIGVSGIHTTEVIGDPNATFSPVPMGGSPNVGGWILVQFLAPTVSGSAFDTPMIPTAPANGSVVGMSFYCEAGSTTIAGE